MTAPDERHDSLDSILRALASSPEISVQPDTLPVGHIVGGRYEIVRLLGRGGLGVVFLARDLDLDRSVALKLHQRFRGPSGLARLEAEARSMASLSHPNLAAVYGIVREQDHLFVVMEYVAGGDVRHWSRQAERAPHEVIEVFISAGRGLAAAHAAGVVHGDFKPDNVLVGSDHRARVIDFGLGLRQSSQQPASSASNDDDASQTSWVGTRGYMAPEQADGVLEPACDQFAFCVSLFETLFGVRPKTGTSESQLIDIAQRMRPQMRGVASLARATARGLREQPADRWPNLDDLLDAIVRARQQRGRSRWAVLGAGLLLAAGVIAATSSRHDPPDCGDAGTALARSYSSSQEPALRSAIESHHAGSQLWPAVDEHLSTWMAAWSAANQATCEDPDRVRQADARRCLSRQRFAFEARLTMLMRASPEVRAHAPRLTGTLPSPEECGDPTRALPRPTDPGLAIAVENVRAALIELETLRASARPAQTLAASQAVSASLSEVEFPQLLPEVIRGTALAELELGDAALGRRRLEEAYYVARQLHRDRLAFNIALDLAGQSVGAPEDADAWIEHARSVASSSTAPDTSLELDYTRGYLELKWGRFEQADVLLARVVAGEASDARAAHLYKTNALLGRAEVAIRSGRYDDADRMTTQAEELVIQVAGRLSPEYAEVLDLRAWANVERGKFDAAQDDAEDALEVAETLFGDAHPLTLRMLGGLSIVEGRLGDLESALGRTRRILAGHQARNGPEHRLVALAHLNLGVDLQRLDRLDEAEEHLREALRQYSSGLGGPLDRSLAQLNLAQLYGKRNRGDDAERSLLLAQQAALNRIVELGEDHLDSVRARINEGAALRRTGRASQAVETLDRARQVLERIAPEHPLRVNIYSELARAALDTDDPIAAKEHARLGIAALEDGDHELRAELEQTMATAAAASPS